MVVGHEGVELQGVELKASVVDVLNILHGVLVHGQQGGGLEGGEQETQFIGRRRLPKIRFHGHVSIRDTSTWAYVTNAQALRSPRWVTKEQLCCVFLAPLQTRQCDNYNLMKAAELFARVAWETPG